jgi:hypothetical protein
MVVVIELIQPKQTAKMGISPQCVSCFCNPISVITTIFVVTVMLATCLPLEGREYGVRTFDYEWRMDCSSRLVDNILGLGSTDSDVVDLITELGKSGWVLRERVSVYGGPPDKQSSCSMPGLSQTECWNIKASRGQSLGADYRSGLFWQHRECVSIWEISRPNLTIGPNHGTRYWCIAAVVPVNSNLLTDPMSVRTVVPNPNREVSKIKNCSLGRTGGIASRLRDLVQFPSKDSEYARKHSRPKGRSPITKEDTEYATHARTFLLFVLCVLAFIAAVGSLIYAFERGRPIFLLATLVCAYVWYLSVSAIKI